MSTCPENDIHSIYIDGELPDSYVKEYESHLLNCEKCRKKLESLKSLKQIFSSDCKNITISKDAMEQSFERLKTKLSYSKVTKNSRATIFDFNSERAKKTFSALRYGAVAAVAAAVVAVIIPVRIGKLKTDGTQFTPVARTTIQSPVNSNIQVDRNVESRVLTSLFNNEAGPVNNVQQNVVQAAAAGYGSYYNAPFAGRVYIPLQDKRFESQAFDLSLTGYDVFCPVMDGRPDGRPMGPSIRFNPQHARFSLETGSEK